MNQLSYTNTQIKAWLRGLYTVAWADGHYDPEEEAIIAQLTQDLVSEEENTEKELKPIEPQELAANLGKDRKTAENFLRTAVLVAVADGVYSIPEYKLLEEFREALGIEVAEIKSLENTLYKPSEKTDNQKEIPDYKNEQNDRDIFAPVKNWLDKMEIKDPRLAHFICRVIPPQCPFERDVNLFGREIAHIPPLCKLNPLYEQLVSLRFRSLSYLADECKTNISKYI